jgi:hypothetical protein
MLVRFKASLDRSEALEAVGWGSRRAAP